MLRLERLKKYGPQSDKLSAGQIELLELEPGVHAQEMENDRGLFGAKAPPKPEYARRNAPPEHLSRREEIIAVEVRRGSAFAAQRSAAALASE